MSEKRQWRGVTAKVAKDKAEIYNSREWHELRTAKLRANPLCERCLAEGKAAGVPDGYITSATCVHHRTPIETAKTKDEMRRLAFDMNNLQSLCFACHAKTHKELGSNTRRIVAQRAQARQERWADTLTKQFTTAKPTADDAD